MPNDRIELNDSVADSPVGPGTITGPLPDCRTCNRAYIRMTNEIGCGSVGNCANADRYEPLPPMRLWRTTP